LKKFVILIGVVAAFLGGVLLSSHFLQPAANTTSVATRANENPVVVREDIGESSAELDTDMAHHGIDAEEDLASARVQSYELQAVIDRSINMAFVLAADQSEENFFRLVEEFRTSTNLEGSRKRDDFQHFFFSQGPILNGQVSLDVLECGDYLCVAELRGVDPAALRSVMDAALAGDEFETKAIIEAPAQRTDTARLIFSHDPEITGIATPLFGL